MGLSAPDAGGAEPAGEFNAATYETTSSIQSKLRETPQSLASNVTIELGGSLMSSCVHLGPSTDLRKKGIGKYALDDL